MLLRKNVMEPCPQTAKKVLLDERLQKHFSFAEAEIFG